MRNRPKRYPYTKSQWEYSCSKLYANRDPEPYCVLWSKKIESREKRGERMFEVLATIAIIVGLLDLSIMAVILIKDLFDFW